MYFRIRVLDLRTVKTVILILLLVFLMNNAVAHLVLLAIGWRWRLLRSATPPRRQGLEHITLLLRRVLFYLLLVWYWISWHVIHRIHLIYIIIFTFITAEEQLCHRESALVKVGRGAVLADRLLLIVKLLLVPPASLHQITDVVLFTTLESWADWQGTIGRCGARRLSASLISTTTLYLHVFLIDALQSCVELALGWHFLMLEGRHAIIVNVLVECIEHCVDRLLRSTVAVRGLMMRIRTLDV